jgi:hypothetical protein
MVRMEARFLRFVVAICSLVPICAGAAGMLLGPRMIGMFAGTDLDSHFRYLSGLLLAIGVAFLSTVPRIEAHGERFRLLTGIVIVGGIGRLISVVAIGPAMLAALAMELLVTPALACWQWRVVRMDRNLARIAASRPAAAIR